MIDSNIRAGDGEREQTGERLRRAHTEGRLDLQEFQDRIDRCYSAKTYGELAALVDDLPGASSRHGLGRVEPRPRPVLRAQTLVPVLLALVVLSASLHGGLGHVLGLLVFAIVLTRVWLCRRARCGARFVQHGSDQGILSR